jgi:hypothetical protein
VVPGWACVATAESMSVTIVIAERKSQGEILRPCTASG